MSALVFMPLWVNCPLAVGLIQSLTQMQCIVNFRPQHMLIPPFIKHPIHQFSIQRKSSEIFSDPTSYMVHVMMKFIKILYFCIEGNGESLHCGIPSQPMIYLELTLTGHTLQPDREIQLFTRIWPHSDGSIFNRFMELCTESFCTLNDRISYLTKCRVFPQFHQLLPSNMSCCCLFWITV